jgi:hypothetical protein
MATNNLDLFSYFPGLEVTADEILEAEILASQVLKAKFPDLDLREGTALRDMVIRPSATLLAMVNKALVFYFTQNTISGVTDETPKVFVDKLLSNWFAERREGNKAVINARLYFAKAKNILISSDTFFSTDGILKYFPISQASFSSSQLTFDVGSNEYYLDIDLEAEDVGKNYEVSNGSLLYFSNFDSYFLHAEINFLRSAGTESETNTEFIDRVRSEISTRNLINVPSIASNLLDNFPIISGVHSIGFGDSEMIRDYIKVQPPSLGAPTWIHNGGAVDIYCRVPVATTFQQFTVDEEGFIYLEGPVIRTSWGELHGVDNDGGDPDTLLPSEHPVENAFWQFENEYLIKTTEHILGPLLEPGVGSLTLIDHGLNPGEYIMLGDRDENGNDYRSKFKVKEILSKDTISLFLGNSSWPPSGPYQNTTLMWYVDRPNDVGFSTRQKLKANIGKAFAGETITFKITYYQDIDSIQSYLEDKTRRVLCADLLARGLPVIFVDLELAGYEEIPDQSVAYNVLSEYCQGLNPGEPFLISALVGKLYEAGIRNLKYIPSIQFYGYHTDCFSSDPLFGGGDDIFIPGSSLAIYMPQVVNTFTI